MKRRKSITELARELRKNPTNGEKLLWEILRKHRLEGIKFVRQKPIIYKVDRGKSYFFIADFYCPSKKFIIELDGKIHDYQKYYDYQRDLVLKKMNLQTLRISNRELSNPDFVRSTILHELGEG